MTGITYPSGRVLSYAFDAQGRVTGVAIGGQMVLSGATYLPFGAVQGWTWANGQQYRRAADLDGRIVSLTLGPDTAAFGSESWSFGYDSLNRLTTAVLPQGETLAYAYDGNGNRKQETRTGALTNYGYFAASNRLQALTGTTSRSFTYDAMGNLISNGSVAFTYDGRGRLTQTSNGYRYAINGLGQRVSKSGPGGTTYFVYDEQGRLLGEYDGAGAARQELVYLGDTPVASVRSGAGDSIAVYPIYTDHLNTPRVVTNQANQIVWEWKLDTFGAGAANENPGGLGVFSFNLRFPGQYYDAETGLHYNYFRDYDPSVGRYVESDPIGLQGGINTYAYADGSPTTKTDPPGLATFMCRKPLHALGGHGVRSGPDIWGNPLYHQYLCINDGKGGFSCGGQDQRGQKWYDTINGPGKPSNDKHDPQTCDQKEPDNNCIEQCLLKKFASPRPRYGIPFGTDCQEWSDDALKDCQNQCKKK
jgi:RHS repeat-associated protein